VKTRVYITIDTECAEERNVGGKQLPLQGYDVRVWGRFENQARDLGIGLIMRELEAQGHRGTFYTEVFGSYSFGRPGLEEAVRTMVARGHDVQLHTHPVQRVADYRTRGVPAAPDDICAYDEARQVELLKEGIGILEACGVPKGHVTSFRAGNFGASNATWDAMAKAGLVVSSNYNPCYFDKNCKMRFLGAPPGLFDTGRGVWELPISNFKDAGGGFRHLQITAVSLQETKRYLFEANARGIGEVMLVTHSFELCHIDDPERRLGRVNSINLLRLRGLCRFLSRRSDLFEVDTAGALGARIRDGREHPATRGGGEYPSGLARHKARRLVEQTIKRIEAKVRLPGVVFGNLARP
jgi:hypothetical protein